MVASPVSVFFDVARTQESPATVRKASTLASRMVGTEEFPDLEFRW